MEDITEIYIAYYQHKTAASDINSVWQAVSLTCGDGYAPPAVSGYARTTAYPVIAFKRQCDSALTVTCDEVFGISL